MTQHQPRRMIFHVAYSLDPNAKSASGIRPMRMLEAFRALGFEVSVVSGNHEVRKKQITELKQQIREGVVFDFAYSESATAPAGLGEPVTRHTSFTRDISFLKFCQRSGVPVGLFYRDIYWRFPIYRKAVRWPLSSVMRAFHRWDLLKYRSADIQLFLPSMEMSKWVPIVRRDHFAELPPGGEWIPDLTPAPTSDPIRILYVGGLGDNYRLHESVRQISNTPGVSLTICTREAEWEARKDEYSPFMNQNVAVVHQSGGELAELYRETDVCLLAVEPIAYWEFAVPMKLFEYVSQGKPIIASAGTYSGRYVQTHDLGWCLNYDSEELAALLQSFIQSPGLIRDAAEQVQRLRTEHTWKARAEQAAALLTQRG